MILKLHILFLFFFFFPLSSISWAFFLRNTYKHISFFAVATLSPIVGDLFYQSLFHVHKAPLQLLAIKLTRPLHTFFPHLSNHFLRISASKCNCVGFAHFTFWERLPNCFQKMVHQFTY